MFLIIMAALLTVIDGRIVALNATATLSLNSFFDYAAEFKKKKERKLVT